jgi:hypothetical protein
VMQEAAERAATEVVVFAGIQKLLYSRV